jgi:spermidine synthase
VAQLGLGAAALTKFCHRQFARAKVTAVELNPAVIVAGRSMFGLREDDARLSVREQDAWDFVMDGAQTASIDALQVDLYDATAWPGPRHHGVLSCLPSRAQGAWRDDDQPVRRPREFPEEHRAYLRRVRQSRAGVPEVHDGNVIALAFNGPAIDVSWETLEARAEVVESPRSCRRRTG